MRCRGARESDSEESAVGRQQEPDPPVSSRSNNLVGVPTAMPILWPDSVDPTTFDCYRPGVLDKSFGFFELDVLGKQLGHDSFLGLKCAQGPDSVSSS